ncbi:DUF3035 domain-containing protein [Celeribacter litoreus]|uniref:DUF3035 domain-containing protein n=1 Tax=Celeribacter litoreus TaxID=2876714 RepID=UPI001CCFC236|nr:DUF3035 domain-containing protein [Celeribacter litoreus]MCA0041884.1 DUF3035 domain-containing protein [Celeribacter litoreus]
MALAALVACGRKGEMLPNDVSIGPDEFTIVPAKDLQEPTDYSALPAPTPGGTNLADATPNEDLIIALGGRVPAATGVDGAIVSYASRYGVDSNIRADLYASDERRREGRGKYERAYRRFALDPWAEWERLRALGIVVPSAPEQ